jgi:hypothetical protein
LEAELRDDAIDGAFADAEVTLAEFLGDDFGAGFGIEEAVADDLTDEFLRAAVIGFRAALGTEQRRAAFFKKERAKLEVALAAEAKLGGGTVNALGAAFALDEHGELRGDFVVGGDGQGTGRTLDAFLEEFKGNHADLAGRVCQHKSIKIWHTRTKKSRGRPHDRQIIRHQKPNSKREGVSYYAIFN